MAQTVDRMSGGLGSWSVQPDLGDAEADMVFLRFIDSASRGAGQKRLGFKAKNCFFSNSAIRALVSGHRTFVTSDKLNL